MAQTQERNPQKCQLRVSEARDRQPENIIQERQQDDDLQQDASKPHEVGRSANEKQERSCYDHKRD
jgi:hypothetical protein